jgi:hypothetical protein
MLDAAFVKLHFVFYCSNLPEHSYNSNLHLRMLFDICHEESSLRNNIRLKSAIFHTTFQSKVIGINVL